MIAFSGRSTADTTAALRRVQKELLLAVAGGTVASFTASSDLTSSDEGADLEGICRVADAALAEGGANAPWEFVEAQ